LQERLAFVYASSKECLAISTFYLTLAFTGARIGGIPLSRHVATSTL
jgi:hypothetical protein